MAEEKQVYNSKKKLKQICEEIGLHDTIQLVDLRSKQIFELYNTYKFAPHLVPYSIVQESFSIISSLEPRLI